METTSLTPSIMPPSPPPLRPQLPVNARESNIDTSNAVAYLVATKNFTAQRKHSHLRFARDAHTTKSSVPLSAMQTSTENSQALENENTSKLREHRSEEREQYVSYNNNNINNSAKGSNKKLYRRTLVTRDGWSDSDDSTLTIPSKRQDSNDHDSINNSLHFEESSVNALLSPTSSMTTLPYNSRTDTPAEGIYEVNECMNASTCKQQDDDESNNNEQVSNNSIVEKEENENSKLNNVAFYNNNNNNNSDANIEEEKEMLMHKLEINTNDYFVKEEQLKTEEEQEEEEEEENTIQVEKEEYSLATHEEVDESTEERLQSRESEAQSTSSSNNTEGKLLLLSSSLSTPSSSSLEMSSIIVSSSESSSDDEDNNLVQEEDTTECNALSFHGDAADNENNGIEFQTSECINNEDDKICELESEEEEREEKKSLLNEARNEDSVHVTDLESSHSSQIKELSVSEIDTRNFLLPQLKPESPCENNVITATSVFRKEKCVDSNSSEESESEQEEELSSEESSCEEELLLEKEEKEKDEQQHEQEVRLLIREKELQELVHDVEKANDIANDDDSKNTHTQTDNYNTNDHDSEQIRIEADDVDGNNNNDTTTVNVSDVARSSNISFETPVTKLEKSDNQITPTHKSTKRQQQQQQQKEQKHEEEFINNTNKRLLATEMNDAHNVANHSELSSLLLASASSTPPPLASLLPHQECVNSSTHATLLKKKCEIAAIYKSTQEQKNESRIRKKMLEMEQQQVSEKELEQVNKLIHKAFIELGGKMVKATISSRRQTRKLSDNVLLNQEANKLTNQGEATQHGILLSRLCRVLNEFGITFDVETFRRENKFLLDQSVSTFSEKSLELAAKKQQRANRSNASNTECSYHSLQLLPFKESSDEYYKEDEEAVVVVVPYNIFANIITNALFCTLGANNNNETPENRLSQKYKTSPVHEKHFYDSYNKKSRRECASQYLSLASKSKPDTLLSSLLSLHEITTTTSAIVTDSNRSLLSSSTLRANNALECNDDHKNNYTRSLLTSSSVHSHNATQDEAQAQTQTHINNCQESNNDNSNNSILHHAKHVNNNNNNSSIDVSGKTNVCTSLTNVRELQVNKHKTIEERNDTECTNNTETDSLLESDVENCNYNTRFTRFASTSTITSSSVRAASLASEFDSSIVDVEFPEVTPNSAIAELCRRIRHRLYTNKHLALQERARQRQRSLKQEHAKEATCVNVEEHTPHKHAQANDKHAHHTNIINHIETEVQRANQVESNCKDDAHLGNEVNNVENKVESTVITTNNLETATRENSHPYRHVKKVKKRKKKLIKKTCNSVESTHDGKPCTFAIPVSSSHTPELLPLPLHTSSSQESLPPQMSAPHSSFGNVNAPAFKRSSLVATLHRPVILSSNVEAQLVRLSPYYTNKFVKFSPCVHRPPSSNDKNCNNNNNSSNSNSNSNNNNNNSTSINIITGKNDSVNSNNNNSSNAAEVVLSETVVVPLSTNDMEHAIEPQNTEYERVSLNSVPTREQHTPALSSASVPSSAASLPLPHKRFVSYRKTLTPPPSFPPSRLVKYTRATKLQREQQEQQQQQQQLPLQWSNKVNELYAQWKQERAFPSLSRPARPVGVSSSANVYNGKESAWLHKCYAAEKEDVKKTNKTRKQIYVNKREANNNNNNSSNSNDNNRSNNAKSDSKENNKTNIANLKQNFNRYTFNRRYEQNWMSKEGDVNTENANTCTDKEGGNKIVNSCSHNCTNAVEISEMNYASCTNNNNDDAIINENKSSNSSDNNSNIVQNGNKQHYLWHNVNLVNGKCNNNNNNNNNNKVPTNDAHIKSRELSSSSSNLAIQWGKMKKCNLDNKTVTLLNSLYQYDNVIERQCNADKEHTCHVDRNMYDKKANFENVNIVNVVDGEEIKQMYSTLNSLYNTKAELETLLHERTYSSLESHSALQLTREQRIIRQIKEKLNQVMSDISRYMQRITENSVNDSINSINNE